MDVIDLEILQYLSKNCRTSIAELANKIKKPRHLIVYRIKRLKEKAIYTGNELILNYTKIGYTEYIIYLKFSNYTSIKREITQFLIKNKHIRWLGEVFPHFDLRLSVITKNMDELESLISQIRQISQNKLTKKEILISRYFLKKETFSTKREIKKTKTDQNRITLNDKGKKLITALSENPTASLLSLAKKTGLSIEAVRKKMKFFEQTGLIEGYSAKFDMKKMKFNLWGNLLIKTDFWKNKDKLQNLLYSTVKYGRTRALFGDWDLEMSFSVNNCEELIKLKNQIEKTLGSDFIEYTLEFYFKITSKQQLF